MIGSIISFIIFWLILVFLVGKLGESRKIGFWRAFALALLLSPLIGFIITLCFKNKEDEAYKAQILEIQKKQLNILIKLQETMTAGSIAGELERLKKLKDDGILNDDEFDVLKKKPLEAINNPESAPAPQMNPRLTLGMLVVEVKTGKQMRIKEINEQEGVYGCYTNGGMVYEGNYTADEIEPFDQNADQ